MTARYEPADGVSTDRPRWSVVVPAYAPGAKLDIAVASVHRAMAGRQDFEVVVVDDCSPSPIAARDDARVIRNETNLGAVPNFNRALFHARGELVHILHADDFVKPAFYRSLERGLASTHAVAAVCRVERVDGGGAVTVANKAEQQHPGIWHDAFARLAVSNRVPAVSIVARRATYDAIGGFDESLNHAADWDMWIRMAQHGPIYYDPEPLAAYRVHDGQHTASVVRTGHNVDEAIAVIRRLADRCEYRPDAATLMARAYAYRFVYAMRTAGRSLRARDLNTSRVQLVAAARSAGLMLRVLVQPRE